MTLMEALDAVLVVPPRSIEKPLRIPIFKSHKVTGIGTVAVGRVATGTLSRGEKVKLMPGNLEGQITSIEIHHTDREKVLPGDLVGFRVKNATVSDVQRGMVACGISEPVKAITSFTAQVVITGHPGEIKAGYCPYTYCHTATFACKWEALLQKLDRRTGKLLEENPKCLKNGESGVVKMVPLVPAYVEEFSKFPPLGRFVIRDQRLTVAVGLVKSVEYGAPAVKPTVSTQGKYFKGKGKK